MGAQGAVRAISVLIMLSTAQASNSIPGPLEGGTAQCPPRRALSAARWAQTCSKPCLSDEQCQKRRCLCDGACGLSCVALSRPCPWPLTVPHGTVRMVGDSRPTFGNWMEVECQDGYRVRAGPTISRHRCQGDQRWSLPMPVCEAERANSTGRCGMPPGPRRGTYHGLEESGGAMVQYSCHPGFRLHGPEANTCLQNGSWERPAPVCKAVYCPPPVEIGNGILVSVEGVRYRAGQSVHYLCEGAYTLRGSHEVMCTPNGTWTATPTCHASCHLSQRRSRVVYRAAKMWLSDIPGHRIPHAEELQFYCLNASGSCSYPVTARCQDGQLQVPPCYQEPTWVRYTLFHWKLVSEIEDCAQK